jgi:hypothetical protein
MTSHIIPQLQQEKMFLKINTHDYQRYLLVGPPKVSLALEFVVLGEGKTETKRSLNNFVF